MIWLPVANNSNISELTNCRILIISLQIYYIFDKKLV